MVKAELWGGEFWTDGYYVATVGERSNWDMVKKYIHKQGKPQSELIQLKLFNDKIPRSLLRGGSLIIDY